jgi:hypothetical protein
LGLGIARFTSLGHDALPLVKEVLRAQAEPSTGRKQNAAAVWAVIVVRA